MTSKGKGIVRLQRFVLVLALAVGALALLGAAATASAAADPDRRAPKLLEIESVRVGTTEAPVVVRVKVPRDASVRAWVNGRRAKEHFHRVGPRIRSAQLSAHNGLRGGSNRVRVRASLPGGRYDREARTLRLPRGAPLADAGRDASALTGETVVHGHPKRAKGTPRARSFRWRMVSAPRGSKARLLRPRSARPKLKPDLHGTYVARVTATRGGRSSHDTIVVTARPPDPPIGVALETLSGAADGAIRIDGAPVKDTTDRNGVFVAVLERTTRQVVESGTVPQHGGGIDQLKSIAAKWGGTDRTFRYLMIVSGAKGWNAGDIAAFNDLVTSLGAEKLDRAERSSLANGHRFSVVGIPGGADGAAWTKIPVERQTELEDSAAGNIHGYLQLNQATENPLAQKHYGLVTPDHLTFDTRSAGVKPTSNTMLLNDQEASASLPSGATAGFHFVLVDSMTGKVLENVAMPTNGGPYEQVPKTQQDIGEQLLLWGYDIDYGGDAPGRPLLFVQSIGHPNGNTLGWNDMAAGMRKFGSSFFVFNGLAGNDDYALAGQVGEDAPAPESSTAAREDGELEGILSRDRDFRYSPLLAADDLSPVTEQIYEVAYQAPTPFPAFATDGERRAETYIGIGLRFCGASEPTCTMRSRYYDNYDGTAWNQKYNDLKALGHPGGSPGFTPDEFRKVKAQLLVEISAVVNIKNYFDVLQKPFVRSQGRSLLDLQKLGDQLKQDVAADDGKSSGWVLELMTAVLALASEGASEAVAPALSGTAAIFGLVSVLSGDDGSPVLADDITAKVDDLSGELADRYELAQRGTTGVALLVVSDWGKMQAVRDRIDNDWKLPPTVDEAIPPLRLASNQWFAQALVPSVYPHLLRATPPPVGPGTPNGTSCVFDHGEGTTTEHPWSGLPASMQVKITLLHERDGSATRTSVWATYGFVKTPSATIGNLLFNAPDGGSPGLGLHPLRFFDPSLFGDRVLSANDTATRCDLPF